MFPCKDWSDVKFNIFFQIVPSLFLIRGYEGNEWYYVRCVSRYSGYKHNAVGVPSEVYFNLIDNSTVTAYYYNGNLHNPFGAAIVGYNLDRIKIYEQYCVSGKLHNRVGPAIRKFENNIWYNEFFIKNKKMNLRYFCEIADNFNN